MLASVGGWAADTPRGAAVCATERRMEYQDDPHPRDLPPQTATSSLIREVESRRSCSSCSPSLRGVLACLLAALLMSVQISAADVAAVKRQAAARLTAEMLHRAARAKTHHAFREWNLDVCQSEHRRQLQDRALVSVGRSAAQVSALRGCYTLLGCWRRQVLAALQHQVSVHSIVC